MHIALIGPTGFIGSKVLEEASRRGHTISAICRHPEKVASLPGVTPRRANVLKRSEGEEAFRGHDIVVSCFNVGHRPDPGQDVYKDTIEGVVNIIKATKLAGVDRLLFVGGAGALYVKPGVQLIDLLEDIARGEVKGADFSADLVSKMPPEFSQWAALLPPDIKQEHIVPLVHALMLFEHDTSYNWSFFSPPAGLHPGARKGSYVLGDNQLPMLGQRFAGLSLHDAAIAIVDEIETRKHDRKHWTAYDPG